jgi:hypothetical protein
LRRDSLFAVMAGPVPAIRRGTLPVLMAGTSPAMTAKANHSGRRVDCQVTICHFPPLLA